MAKSRSSKRKSSKSSRSARPVGGAHGARPPAESGFYGSTFWSDQSLWVRHLVCAGFMLVVALGFFWPVNFGGQHLVGSDIEQWRSMAQSMIEYREATGEQALWAVNPFAGMPGYMINYPLSVPQLDTLVRALNVLVWPTFQFLVLLLGMYAFVVYLTRNSLAGLFAACAYGLTTHMPLILGVGHNSKFIAFSYAPWLLLAFVHMLRKPTLLAGLLYTLALGLNLRARHPQITYFVGFMVGVWWIVEGIRAYREGRLKTFGVATAYLAGGTLLGLLMVAQPYLPFQEYKAYTIRGATAGGTAGEGALDWDYAMGWSHAPIEMLTYFIADALGRGGATYWGPKVFTEGPHYLGGIVLVLAALALWRVRRPTVWALGIAALLGGVFALGRHAAFINRFMFEYFPLFDAFRAPQIWLIVVELALAALAGYGLYDLTRREDKPEEEEAKTLAAYTAFGGALLLAALLLFAHDALFSFEKENEIQLLAQQFMAQGLVENAQQAMAGAQQYLAQFKQERMDLFTASATRTLIFLLLAGVLVVLYRRRVLPGWFLQMALVLLVTIDLWGVGQRFLGPEKLSDQTVEAEIPKYGFDEFILQQVEAAGGPGHFRVLSFERNPTQWARPAFYYETLNGYHGAKLRLYQDFLDHLMFDASNLPNDNALDLAAARYIVAQGQLPGTNVVFTDPTQGLSVLERLNVPPRTRWVGSVEVIEEPQAAWAHLQSPAFDPATMAVVHGPVDFDVTPLDSTSTADVTLQSYGPREIVWNVTTDAPRLLVTSEVYHPAGWSATVDDEEVEIRRVNHLFRGVPVPAGAHTVTMRFAPSTHTLSIWVAGATTALVYGLTLVLMGLAWIRRRGSDAGPRWAVPQPNGP